MEEVVCPSGALARYKLAERYLVYAGDWWGLSEGTGDLISIVRELGKPRRLSLAVQLSRRYSPATHVRMNMRDIRITSVTDDSSRTIVCTCLIIIHSSTRYSDI